MPLSDEHEARLRKDDPVLESMLADETGFQLLAAIELLEMRRDRDVIRMHYLESRSLPDIAAALGVPVGTLYVIKVRALARLRSILEGRATNAGAPRA
ncbi:MAG: sigma-70 family RNA polymerase sigma factor [Paludibaculum sp.]